MPIYKTRKSDILNIKDEKNTRSCITNDEVSSMNEKENYIDVLCTGFDKCWPKEKKFKLENAYYSEIQFLGNSKIRFYLKNNIVIINECEYEHECNSILLNIFIQLKKDHSFILEPLMIDWNDSVKELNDDQYIKIEDDFELREEIEVKRYNEDGTLVNSEEFERQQEKIKQDKFQNEIDLSSPVKTCIRKNQDKILKVLQIKDPIIQYFMLYSWLCSLCGDRQNKTMDFIKNSNTYNKDMNGIQQTFLRHKDTNKGISQKVEEDAFTYFRNLIGHSVNDILSFSSDKVINEIKTLLDRLFLIVLEKLECTNDME